MPIIITIHMTKHVAELDRLHGALAGISDPGRLEIMRKPVMSMPPSPYVVGEATRDRPGENGQRRRAPRSRRCGRGRSTASSAVSVICVLALFDDAALAQI